MIRSRAAPWLARLFALTLVVFAALPDAGVGLPPTVYLLMLALLYALAEAFRAVVHGAELDAYANASESIGYIISSLAGKVRRTAASDDNDVLRHPAAAVTVLLRKAKDLVCGALKIPAGEHITANLLLPEGDDAGRVVGLRASEHDDIQPNRSHGLIPLDAPGAGRTFSSGEPAAVPYTEDEEHHRVRDRSYRSIATFPIFVGTPGRNGAVVAVLSLDSTKPYRFTRSTVRKLNPFISPLAQLIGFALTLEDRRPRR